MTIKCRKTNDFMDLKALHTACIMSQKENKHIQARTTEIICHTQATAYVRVAVARLLHQCT
jgi:hypothetical protein